MIPHKYSHNRTILYIIADYISNSN